MTDIFYDLVSKDYVDALNESYHDYLDKEQIEEYVKEENYEEIFEEFTSSLYTYFKPAGYEVYNLYGRINIDYNIYIFNKEYYRYLLKYMIDLYDGEVIEYYSKLLKFLLEKMPQSPIVYFVNMYYEGYEEMLIEYKDNAGKISKRVISDIDVDFENQRIKAFCKLRQDKREFKMSSLISVDYVT